MLLASSTRPLTLPPYLLLPPRSSALSMANSSRSFPAATTSRESLAIYSHAVKPPTTATTSSNSTSCATSKALSLSAPPSRLTPLTILTVLKFTHPATILILPIPRLVHLTEHSSSLLAESVLTQPPFFLTLRPHLAFRSVPLKLSTLLYLALPNRLFITVSLPVSLVFLSLNPPSCLKTTRLQSNWLALRWSPPSLPTLASKSITSVTYFALIRSALNTKARST